LKSLSEDDFLSLLYSRLNQENQGKAIATPATAFDSESDYFRTVYNKTALWMYVMEKSIGKKNLDKGMHNYFKEWKFKHVYPENLQSSLEEATRIGLKNLFSLLQEKGPFN
ncbi:MAG TPA: M1 family aminopeptidase, partial [Puia sp.]|nr:M1 family aminopeptidase [Puia sp.]